MNKRKSLYLISLGFQVVAMIFIALLIFIKVVNRSEEYILVTRIFSSGIGVMFFYLAYSFSLITLILAIISIAKDNLIIQRISLFFKLYFVIFLITPFFTSIYYEFAHESQFFVYNLLAVGFLIVSSILEGFSIKNHEDNTHSADLIKQYKTIVNLDYFVLLIAGIGIIIASFIYGDFYEFSFGVLSNIPVYYLPLMALIFYIYNSMRVNYLSSKYFFSLSEIIKSRFIYYYVSYLTITRLGNFAYSHHSFYKGLQVFRLILFLVFIAVVIFNSFLPKIDLSFLLSAIIITLFAFEMIGLAELIKNDSDIAYIIFSYLLDYLILVLIAIPYYIFNGINCLFFRKGEKKIN